MQPERYFIDTEFIEKNGKVTLISLGIVTDKGRMFYAETAQFDEREASDWVKENVLKKLVYWNNPESLILYNNAIATPTVLMPQEVRVFGSINYIRDQLLQFITEEKDPMFYGYFSDYDWVAFCSIFGTMIDLPKNYPMFCLDLKQIMFHLGVGREWKEIHCPIDPDENHNALYDAIWNKKLFDELVKEQINTPIERMIL